MIGQTISHYRITTRIGEGGMGKVYLADDLHLNRRVALKFVPDRYVADEAMVSRFVAEARAAAALNHPNIVPIYEVSEHRGRPFIVMEFIEGQPLNTMIADEQIPYDQIVDIASQTCEALQEAHEAGIVHRDIKPSNILVDTRGRVRLVDFGLATVAAQDPPSPIDTTSGTVAFTSPEQLQGVEPSPPSDLFSLGVVLYQMITGRLPFSGRYEAAVIYAIANTPPPALNTLRPDVPVALERVVARLLEKTLARRYGSAAEVLDDLQEYSSDSPAVDGPVLGRPSMRRYLLYAAAIVVALIGAVAGLNTLMGPSSGIKPGREVVAVLPFENLGRPEDEYFSDGMTDAIEKHLAKFGDLIVISRSSSMQYKRSTKSIREIGEELGADYLLAGTIQWDPSGDTGRIRIGTSLIRSADGAYRWTDTYDALMEEVFPLQSDIAQRVTRALNVAVRDGGNRPLGEEPTRNLEAYDLYLRGNDYFNRGWSQSDLLFAIELYERAIVLDTEFAAAYAMLSRGHAGLYAENYDLSRERLQKAETAAQSALALDPDLPEAHLALGYCYYGAYVFDSALAEFAIVEEIEPNNRHLYSAIADVHRRQGDFAKALTSSLRALELDPRSFKNGFDVGVTYGLMREYDKAVEYMGRTTLLAPDWPLPYIFEAWVCILEDGDIPKARVLMDAASGRVDMGSSKYYWWLSRILESDLGVTLEQARPGADTAAYYLYCAGIHRLMGYNELEYQYADSARSLLESQKTRLSGQALFHSQLGLAYAGLRQQREAIENAQMAVRLLPRTREAYDAQFLVINLAKVLLIFGEHDAAVELLERLLSMSGLVTVQYLALDPVWEPLHEHPGFQRLLQAES